jgi:subtilisin family serine protease
MKGIRLLVALLATVTVAFTSMLGVNTTVAQAQSNAPATYATAALPAADMPDDPYYPKQWALPLMRNLPTADGNQKIIVAVLDSGIDMAHEDLAGKIIGSVNFTGSKTEYDIQGHGTHIAGILAANINNHIGIAGAAPNAKLLNVKVVEDNGMVSPSNVAKGIVWAVDHGAKVINMSFVIPTDSNKLAAAVKYAAEHGVILVAASGNYVNSLTYPAAYPDVIAVAALNPDSTLWAGSNDNARVDAYAPGVDIYSTVPGNHYEYKSGSSMATAYVSALAALTLSGLSDAGGDGRISAEILYSLKTFSLK